MNFKKIFKRLVRQIATDAEAIDIEDGERFDLDRDIAFVPSDVIQEKEQ